MKVYKQLCLIIGITLVFTSAAWSEEIEDEADQTERNIQTRAIRVDEISARHHHHHGHHHHHAHHLHHGHHHHAHHLHHFAHHHPILTKKLVLLKLKKLKPHIIKHHLHHKHHHHAHLHHGHHHHHHGHHLHHLHHHPFHHHFFRTQADVNNEGYIELVPVEEPIEAAYPSESYEPTPVEYADETPTLQTYGATSEYIQPVNEVENDSEVDDYEPVPLEDIPEVSPVHKHLAYDESSYDPSSSVFLYAVPQSAELRRSSPR